MKPTFYIALLYLCLSLLVISCSEDAPVPAACIQAEVVGPDCENGWYVLRLLNDDFETEGQSGCFIGQIHSGMVTTDNLPDAYQQEGMRIAVALELNGEYSPRCVATSIMYPAVRVTHICTGRPDRRMHSEATVSRGNRLLSKLVRYIA